MAASATASASFRLESEMFEPVLEAIPSIFPANGYATRVLREPSIGNVIPDLLIGQWSSDAPVGGPPLTNVARHILAFLQRRSSRASTQFIEDKLFLSPSGMARALAQLSRARDQMWVVHSLNYETDLKPGDYRRRLIEHAVDPEAWERELERQVAQIDPRSQEFEGRVLRRLMEANFRVFPQYKVGSYRIDLVVVGSGKRLAVECDGERYHGPEKLQDDMARQAILERLGWQFVRVRGSVFFRDEERAMRPVFQRLDELGIAAELGSELGGVSSASDSVTQRVIRRAEELRTEWSADTSPAGKGEILRRLRRRTSV
jgi:very-short-patch-repair endonuclease